MNRIRLIYILTISLYLVVLGATSALGQPAKRDPATEERKLTINEAHQRFTVDLNNLVWNLLEKDQRTRDENERMVHAAHASHYHWSVIGHPINLARGYWLISHVYAVLNQAGPALYFATRCWDVTSTEGFIDFDLAYAYEALARAHASNGDKENSQHYLQLAQEAGEKIKNHGDRDLFFTDLKTGPWYGINIQTQLKAEPQSNEIAPDK